MNQEIGHKEASHEEVNVEPVDKAHEQEKVRRSQGQRRPTTLWIILNMKPFNLQRSDH